LRGVEFVDQLAVSGACSVEFPVAFLELQPQVDDLLFEEDDALFELFESSGARMRARSVRLVAGTVVSRRVGFARTSVDPLWWNTWALGTSYPGEESTSRDAANLGTYPTGYGIIE
jgi:hypothetical protein